MKILVYTLGIALNLPFSKRKEILDLKKAALKEEYPHLNVMVIPGPEHEGDKVFVADMTYYGQTLPNFTSVGHPHYTVSGSPVVSTTASYTVAASDHDMFKMSDGLNNLMTEHDRQGMYMTASANGSATAENPMGENVVDFKPK